MVPQRERPAATSSLAALVLIAVGCGAPQQAVPPAQIAPAPSVSAAPAAAVATAPAVPEEAGSTSPFSPGQTWLGEYTCRQGLTELRLRVQSVRGGEVDALFEFRHQPTSVEGKFELTGLFDTDSRRAVLAPRAWVQQPANYIMVGMDGRVADDGRTFSGRISTEGCTTFSVRLR